MNKEIKKIISTALAASLVLSVASCGQGQGAPKEFSPKLATDTQYKLSVVGTYSNFESLEREFERFYAHYPNGEIQYTSLDDYSNTIVQALAGQEPPDIFVVQPWMYGNEKFESLFEAAEVLSDPDLKARSQKGDGRWEHADTACFCHLLRNAG